MTRSVADIQHDLSHVLAHIESMHNDYDRLNDDIRSLDQRYTSATKLRQELMKELEEAKR